MKHRDLRSTGQSHASLAATRLRKRPDRSLSFALAELGRLRGWVTARLPRRPGHPPRHLLGSARVLGPEHFANGGQKFVFAKWLAQQSPISVQALADRKLRQRTDDDHGYICGLGRRPDGLHHRWRIDERIMKSEITN
jgi:hypothetical protein